MIWIASFPGSGVELFCDILKKVYEQDVKEFNENQKVKKFGQRNELSFVRTNRLPYALPGKFNHYPSICIVRDGRNAIVEFTKSITKKNSSLNKWQHMADIISAADGKHFGGWSIYTAQWVQKSKIIIRYEDLILDPVGQVEKIREMCPDLPVPKIDNDKLKQHVSEIASPEEVNWSIDMLSDLEEMFWGLHGDTMEVLGYDRNKAPISTDNFANKTFFREESFEDKKRVLIEASTLLNPQMDGTMRYIHTMLRAIHIEMLKKPLNIDIRAKLDSIRTLSSLFQQNKKKPKKERKNLPHKVFSYIIGFPRQVKRVLPNRMVQIILFIANFTGLLRLYRFSLQLFNTKLLKEYEHNKLDLVHLTLPQRQIKKDISHKITVTIHDLTCKLFPQFHARHSVKGTDRNMKEIEKQKVNLIAVSHHTKSDVLKHYNFEEKNITVIYEAIDHEKFYPIFDENLRRSVLDKYKLVDKRFFFSLCTLEPRKNLKNTIQAFVLFCERHPESDVRFVISGAYGWKLGKLAKHPKIQFTGYLPENELAALYSSAIGMCYVSFYEGFGLPPLEAMRCKTVPIYGKNSSMVEIIGNYGLGADPHNPEHISEQMEKLAFDDELRVRMEEKAYKKSWEFTLGTLGKNTIKYYSDLIVEDQVKV